MVCRINHGPPYQNTPMPSVTFYPLGNADSYLLKLDRKLLLFDFGNMSDPDAEDDRRINLPEAIREDIGWPNRKDLDVVAFTHLDNDHVKGSGDFFFLDHAAKYQDGDRVKIKELWVPSAAITEEGAEDDARIIRQEARHRLLNGKGIRVFSRPAHLKEFLEANGLTLESRAHLITDAGQLVPSFTKGGDGVEFFVHSPFGERDSGEILDRNETSLVFQATFQKGDTRFLMAADTVHENWDKIVRISRAHGNADRLTWDIYKLPHHCSYLSLAPDKGKTETKPIPNVEWLLAQGKPGAYIVCTSNPIDDEESTQPPHFQSKNTYLRALIGSSGKFKVTMEHPNRINPARLVIEITAGGARLATPASIGTGALVGVAAPRAG